MKKESLKYIIILVGFIICFVVLDICVGKFFDYKITQLPADGERIAKTNYAINNVNSDGVVIGSSRAETGYNPKVLMDSIPELSFYNCGGDGQDFYYCNTVINCILDRYSPDSIIWDFKERQLGGSDDENLSLIYPYYWKNNTIRSVIDEREGWKPNVLLRINSYRYNATAGRILRSIYLPNHSSQNTFGFGPRPVHATSTIINPNDFTIGEEPLNENKVEYFIKTLKRAQEKGCKIVVVISPMYNKYNEDNVFTRETRKLCLENGAYFIDDSHLEGFVHNNAYAYDSYHLNVDGANHFTKVLAGQLKEILR